MKMPEIVICNTSPLFYLHRIGVIELLEKLYKEIIIPYGVVQELEEGREVGEDVPDLNKYLWIRVKKVVIPSYLKIICDLGRGETEVISLAIESKDPLLIIDDKIARQIARLQGLKITGTAGVLLKAKERGFIGEIKPLLTRLKDAGFYITDSLTNSILRLAHES